MDEISIYELIEEDSVDKEKLVATFPYTKLIDINPTDLGSIRGVFHTLQKITKHDMFYGNSKAVKCVLEFVTDVLSNCTTPQSKNEFVIAHLLLNNLLSGMKSTNKMGELDKVFIEIIFHVSAFDNYCPLSSKYSVNMVLRVLENMTDSDCVSVDEKIARIIDNMIRVQADYMDIARLTPIVFRRYLFLSETFSVNSKWLMHTTIQLLENYSLEGINEENPALTVILRASSKLLFESLKLTKSGSANIAEAKTFLDNVTKQVHKITHLCCVSSVKQDARSILELILLKFLDDQHISGKENNICEEVEKLPEDVAEWPYYTCKTFFWLCHLVYYSKRVVWSSSEICNSISRLLYKPKYRILIDRHVLKSLLFIYPITLTGKSNMKKKLIIGDEIQNIIVPEFMPLINEVLSINPIQLQWILFKFPEEIKMAVVKFWLQNSEPQHLAILEENLFDSKSHDLLINIMMEYPKNLKVIKLIENLQDKVTFENIQSLIDKNINKLEATTLLLKIFRRVIPRNQKEAFRLLISMREILMMNLDENTLTNALLLVNNLLNCLKSNQKCIIFLVEDEFWFKLLLSEFNNHNEKLVKTVLDLFILLLGHCGTCKVKVLTFDLTYALSMSDSVVEKAVQFLMLVLRTGLLEPEESTISQLFSQLCSLAGVQKLASQVYVVLKSLVEKTQKLISAPSLQLLIEQQISFSNRPDFSVECQQFILYYIDLVHSNKTAIPHMYYLPPKMLLVMFLRRCKVFSETTKFLRSLDEIYEIREKNKFIHF